MAIGMETTNIIYCFGYSVVLVVVLVLVVVVVVVVVVMGLKGGALDGDGDVEVVEREAGMG